MRWVVVVPCGMPLRRARGPLGVGCAFSPRDLTVGVHEEDSCELF